MTETVLFLEPKGTALEVIRAAGQRGYNVVAMTSDSNLFRSAPLPYRTANSFIQQVIQVKSWTDSDAIVEDVRKLNDSKKIAGIYFGLDVCALVGTELRKMYGMPSPASKTIDLVIDKFHLRKNLRENGLSKLTAYSGQEADTWTTWPFSNSAYFKPVRGAGSAYVKKCDSLSDMRIARDYWVKGDDTDPSFIRQHIRAKNEYFVEETMEGELLSVEAISTKGQFHVLGLLSRILYSKDSTVEMGSCFPYFHPLQSRIIEFAQKIHEHVGFLEGPSHTEFIVSPDGQLELIDFNPRFVGADVLQSINYAFETKIEETLLDFALGNVIHFPESARNACCLQYVLPPHMSRFESIDFPSDPTVKFSTSYLVPGTKIRSHERQLDYLGCYLTVMPTFEEAILKSRTLRDRVIVNRQFEGVY